MGNRSGDVARRGWKLLRLALSLARKGGVFKRRLMMQLRLVPNKFLKSLGHTAAAPRGQIYYGEHELSFEKTPIFHVKMYRPRLRSASMRCINIPCITPQVDDDLDFDMDDDQSSIDHHHHHHHHHIQEDEEVYEYDCCDEDYGNKSCGGDDTPVGEEGIDLRAEKFIAQFYEQMKLQRQISYLQYHQ